MKSTWPRSIVPFCASRRMIESEVTDLPEPDSPTIPSVEPGSTANESPLTAATVPSSVRNVVLRSRTSKSAKAGVPRCPTG